VGRTPGGKAPRGWSRAPGSAEPAGDGERGLLIGGIGEDLLGGAELDDLPHVKKAVKSDTREAC